MENISNYLPIALVIIAIAQTVWIIFLDKRVTKLTRGTKGTSLETIINSNNKALTEMVSVIANQQQDITKLEGLAQKSLRNVGVIRYKALNTGGNQSFAIALTNNNNDGVVLSTMYTPGHVNVFAKPISSGTSTFTLTEEEQQALHQSRN